MMDESLEEADWAASPMSTPRLDIRLAGEAGGKLSD